MRRTALALLSLVIGLLSSCSDSELPARPNAGDATVPSDADGDAGVDGHLQTDAATNGPVDAGIDGSALEDSAVDSHVRQEPIAPLSVAHNSSCAIVDGKVYCWGSAQFGQLGEGTRDDDPHPTPLQLPVSDARFVRLSRWANHVVTANGELWAAGLNNHGQLPFESTALKRVDVEPVSLAVGSYDVGCIVMRADGEVRCRGSNDLGGVGDGSTESRDVYVSTGLKGVTAIVAGLDFVCAVSGGALYCWGNNDKGQVGNGKGGDGAYEVAPTKVSVPGVVRAVAAGSRHACASNSEGAVYCWGINWGKQAGASSDAQACGPHACVRAPQSVDVTASGDLALSDGASCVIDDAGNVACWGSGAAAAGGAQVGAATALASGHESNHFCAATAAKVLCWGNSDTKGQLGRGGVVSDEQAKKPAPVALP